VANTLFTFPRFPPPPWSLLRSYWAISIRSSRLKLLFEYLPVIPSVCLFLHFPPFLIILLLNLVFRSLSRPGKEFGPPPPTASLPTPPSLRIRSAVSCTSSFFQFGTPPSFPPFPPLPLFRGAFVLGPKRDPSSADPLFPKVVFSGPACPPEEGLRFGVQSPPPEIQASFLLAIPVPTLTHSPPPPFLTPNPRVVFKATPGPPLIMVSRFFRPLLSCLVLSSHSSRSPASGLNGTRPQDKNSVREAHFFPFAASHCHEAYSPFPFSPNLPPPPDIFHREALS